MLVPLMGKQAQSSIKILILFINHCAKILIPPPPFQHSIRPSVKRTTWMQLLSAYLCYDG